ncbi:uncharacterized protein P7C73_g4846, partial [Tremellales sp. Uapishka_1]
MATTTTATAAPVGSHVATPSQREKAIVPGHTGYLNEGQNGYQGHIRRRANPAPLGLFSFATTTLLLSLIYAHARHASQANVIVGLALALGGLAEFVAGIFEFCVGNTFGMTAFCSYGAFYFAIGIMFWPTSGVFTSYTDTGLDAALGLFMMAWMVFTFFMLLATFRSSMGLVALFFFLTLTFMLLGIGYFRSSISVLKAGGWFGIIVSLIAFYVGAHSLLESEAAPFALPNPSLARKNL